MSGSEAIAAVVGIVLGTLGTLVLQTTLGRLERLNISRGACRVMFADLREARDIVANALRDGEWSSRRGFAHIDASWREHRDNVSRAMGTRDFHAVAGAFKAIESLQVGREANANTADSGFALHHQRIMNSLPRIEKARGVLSKTGCTWWERHVTIRPGAESSKEIAVAAPKQQ